MPTRHGKIARLPLTLREELNCRMQNGQLSPALLPWLNQLPEVQSLLAQSFAGRPISRQNLSEWRLGGYRDWLKLQERQLLIRRIAEEGVTLKQQEGKEDLFENFARIAVTELYADFDALDQLQGDDRWKRLRSLTRELACLQREYNRSRQVELSWEKWNSQFEDATEEGFRPAESPTAGLSPKPAACLQAAKFHPLPAGEGEQSTSQPPQTPPIERGDNQVFHIATSENLPPVKVDQAASTAGTQPAPPVLETVDRHLCHRRCRRGCVCPDCHPEDGIYPYSQAVKDDRNYEDHSSPYWIRGNVRLWVTHVDCDCYCDCDITRPFKLQENIPNAL
jgi:hypothetical protein